MSQYQAPPNNRKSLPAYIKGETGRVYTWTTGAFTVPAVDADVVVSIDTAHPFPTDAKGAGQQVYIDGAGVYLLVSVDASAKEMTLTNTGFTGNAAPATEIASGANIMWGTGTGVIQDLVDAAQASQTAAENARNLALSYRDSAGSHADDAADHKDLAFSYKTAAESAQGLAEAAQTAAESAQGAAEAAQSSAEGWAQVAEQSALMVQFSEDGATNWHDNFVRDGKIIEAIEIGVLASPNNSHDYIVHSEAGPGLVLLPFEAGDIVHILTGALAGESRIISTADTLGFEVSVPFSGVPEAGTRVMVGTNLAYPTLTSGDPYPGDKWMRFRNNANAVWSQPIQLMPFAELSVKDFGAVGDGTTNDHAAISAALTYIKAAGGGTLRFPRGEYVIEDDYETASFYRHFDYQDTAPLSLIGESGAKVVLKHDAGVGHTAPHFYTQPLFFLDGCSDVAVRGLHFVRDETACGLPTETYAAALYFVQGKTLPPTSWNGSLLVEDCTFTNWTVGIVVTGDVERVRVRDCIWNYTNGHHTAINTTVVPAVGIRFVNPGNSGVTRFAEVTGCDWQGSDGAVTGTGNTGVDGLFYGSALHLSVTNNRIIRAAFEGIFVFAIETASYFGLAEQGTVVISNNSVDCSVPDGVASGDQTTGWGIRCDAPHAVITGNNITNAYTGIFVSSGDDDGDNIRDDSLLPEKDFPASDVSITGNRIAMPKARGTKTSSWMAGIHIQSSGSGFHIKDNVVLFTGRDVSAPGGTEEPFAIGVRLVRCSGAEVSGNDCQCASGLPLTLPAKSLAGYVIRRVTNVRLTANNASGLDFSTVLNSQLLGDADLRNVIIEEGDTFRNRQGITRFSSGGAGLRSIALNEGMWLKSVSVIHRITATGWKALTQGWYPTFDVDGHFQTHPGSNRPGSLSVSAVISRYSGSHVIRSVGTVTHGSAACVNKFRVHSSGAVGFSEYSVSHLVESTFNLGTDPVTVVERSKRFEVTVTGHGLAGVAMGFFIIEGAALVNGLDPNGIHLVRVKDANTLYGYADTAATASGSGGGAAADCISPMYFFGTISYHSPFRNEGVYSQETAGNASDPAPAEEAVVVDRSHQIT